MVSDLMHTLPFRWTSLLSLLIVSSFAGAAHASPTLSPIQLTQLHYTLQSAEQVLTPASGETSSSFDPRKAEFWVVTFVSARCPCSAAHEERMTELAKKFGGQKFAFLGIHANADEPASEARVHFTASQLPFRVIEDSQNQWLTTLGALKTPHSYIIEARTGRIVYQGGIDDSAHPSTASRFYLSEVLDDINQGKPPRIEVSRALGCQIKRK